MIFFVLIFLKMVSPTCTNPSGREDGQEKVDWVKVGKVGDLQFLLVTSLTNKNR